MTGATTVSTCGKCKSSDLVQIELTPVGRSVRFSTCRACEHRWWTTSDGDVALELRDVLDLVAAA
jgi:hypothetical protein